MKSVFIRQQTFSLILHDFAHAVAESPDQKVEEHPLNARFHYTA